MKGDPLRSQTWEDRLQKLTADLESALGENKQYSTPVVVGTIFIAAFVGIITGLGTTIIKDKIDGIAAIAGKADPQVVVQLSDADSLLNYVLVFLAIISSTIVFILWFVASKRLNHVRDSRDTIAAVVGHLLSQNEEALNGLKRDYSEVLVQVRKRLLESEEIAKALQAKHEPYLISWEKSGDLERASECVDVLTPNLVWLAHEPNFVAILNDIFKNSSNRYRYLVYSNQDPQSDQDLILSLNALKRGFSAPFIKGAVKANLLKKLEFTDDQEIIDYVSIRIAIKMVVYADIISSDRKIRSLRTETVDVNETRITNHSEWAVKGYWMPLPGDVAIYRNVNVQSIDSAYRDIDSIVVISRAPVSWRTVSGNSSEKLDLLLKTDTQVNPIRGWFNNVWDS